MVWPFHARRKDKPSLRDLAPEGFVDVHCHVLPGLDDGPKEECDSVRMLESFESLGYSCVIATPHWHHSGFATPAQSQMEHLVEALNARERTAPQVVAGAEIAFDDRFFPALEAGALPHIGNARVFLVELPALPGSLPHGFEDAVFRLAAQGVTLVLAHAERIPDFQRESTALGGLRRAGALVQVDLTSLAGKHGRTASSRGWLFVERGEADVVGTDAHAPSDMPFVERALAELNAFDSAELVRLASSNPARILSGAVEEVERHA
jgi:protein-tyrosine phosphatase